VDGHPGEVLRGDHALLTVHVPPRTRRLEFNYHSKTYARGKGIALVSLLVVLAWLFAPRVIERRRPIA
jgi:hypothetical protein